jgi:hypothetical protein
MGTVVGATWTEDQRFSGNASGPAGVVGQL